MSITVTKRDGTREPFNADKINRSIERACVGLTDPVSMVTQIALETELTIYDGITSEEMDHATINAAVQNIQNDIEFDKVATRLLLKTVYRRVIGSYENDFQSLRNKHRDEFPAHIQKGVEQGLLDKRMVEKFDLKKLAQTLDIRRDDYDYALARKMINVWRKTADLLLYGDYYPHTEFHRSAEAWVAWQFDCPETGRGLVQAVRFPDAAAETLTIQPQGVQPAANYLFENPETGETKQITGEVLCRDGFTFTLPARSGAIWLYQTLTGL